MASCDYSIPIYRQVIIQIASTKEARRNRKQNRCSRLRRWKSLPVLCLETSSILKQSQCSVTLLNFSRNWVPGLQLQLPVTAGPVLAGGWPTLQSIVVTSFTTRLQIRARPEYVRYHGCGTASQWFYMALRLHTSFTNITLHREWSEVIFSEVIFRPYKLGDWSKVNSRLNDLGRIAKSSSNIYDTTVQ